MLYQHASTNPEFDPNPKNNSFLYFSFQYMGYEYGHSLFLSLMRLKNPQAFTDAAMLEICRLELNLVPILQTI